MNQQLDWELVQYYFRAGLADTTRRMYDSVIKKFNEFCKEHNVPSSAPIDQTMICYYVSYLAKAGLQASSIKVYLAALRHTQIARTGTELELSKMPKLKILQSGIRRTQALLPKQSLTRLPITPTIMGKIKEVWSPRAQEEDTMGRQCTVFLWFLSHG